MVFVNAQGVSGRSYQYNEAQISGDWKDVPANYMFAFWNGTHWHVLYIGQCASARDRLPCHERWEEARKLGATHVLNHVASPDEEIRKTEERDLIASHTPVLNTHYQPRGLLGSGALPLDPQGLIGLGALALRGTR